MPRNGKRLFAYEYNGYWKDVGTLGSLLGSKYGAHRPDSGVQSVRGILEDLHESDIIEPTQYLSADSVVEEHHRVKEPRYTARYIVPVIGPGVTIGGGDDPGFHCDEKEQRLAENAIIDKSIIAENCQVEANTELGIGRGTE